VVEKWLLSNWVLSKTWLEFVTTGFTMILLIIWSGDTLLDIYHCDWSLRLVEQYVKNF